MKSEESSQSLKAYLWYLKNVLGITEVLRPQLADPTEDPLEISRPSPDRTQVLPRREKKVLFTDTIQWSAEVFQLFEKMREAMGLASDEIDLHFGHLDSSELEMKRLIYPEILFFKDSLPSDAQALFVTFSPRVLIAKPELKRKTWEDLKLLMARLKESSNRHRPKP